jgi:hypothetical protein
MKRLKNLVVFISILIASTNSSGQEKILDRISYGGNLGFQFGDPTFIDISPQVGYQVTERFIPGISFRYMRFKSKYYDYKSNIIGGGLFARYFLTESLFLQSEIEQLAISNFMESLKLETTVSSFFIGGGYRQILSGNFSTNILILYNLNESRLTPYSNPIIRIGFGVGF